MVKNSKTKIHSAILAISSPSYFTLETFSRSVALMKMYASRHTLHLKNVLLITVCTTNTCVNYSQNRKHFSPAAGFFPCFAPIFFANMLFFPDWNHDLLFNKNIHRNKCYKYPLKTSPRPPLNFGK